MCLASNSGVSRQKCPRKTVIAIARLQTDGSSDARDLYTARYSNCWQGRSEANLHAERFMVSDASLSEALDRVSPEEGGALYLYLTYQPCHHSGGHGRRGMGSHGTSCSELLEGYVRDVLTPRRVRLVIKIAYVYRAHWQITNCDSKYLPAIEAARRGLQLLVDCGVALKALDMNDWAWLASQCDEQVAAEWDAGEQSALFGSSTGLLEARARLDEFFGRFLAGFTPSTPSSSSQPSTVVSASTVAALTDEEGCLDCVEDERPPSASAEPIEQPPAAAA